MPLHPKLTPELHPDESPMSFCSRAAFLNGRSARDFCLDMGFTFQEIIDGVQSAQDSLARLCNIPEGTDLGTPIRRDGRAYWIGANKFTRATLSRQTLFVCPHCLADDISRSPNVPAAIYGRTRWLVSSLRTCAVHEASLVPACNDERPSRIHDFTMLVAPTGANLAQIARASSHRNCSPLEEYLMARLENRPGEGNWLDRFPAYAAARICEFVGAVSEFGVRFHSAELTPNAWWHAGGLGYEIVRAGPEGIGPFLCGLQSQSSGSQKAWAPRMMYGRLYEWLAHESEDSSYDPLRHLIREHAIDTLPLGPGEEIFGIPVETRKLHSLRSASEEYAVHPKRLRKILHEVGVIADDAMSLTDERIMFPASEGSQYIARASQSMSMAAVRDYLNIPRPIDRSLFEAGILVPWVRGGNETLHHHAFAKTDLDDLMQRLMKDALPNDQPVLQDIPAAARRANCSQVEIVQLILDRKLKTVRLLPEERGYLSLLVNVEEVKPHVRLEGHGGLSLRQVEREMHLSSAVVKGLLVHGHLPSQTAVNPINRCPQTIVKRTDLEQFMGDFSSLHTLSRETGIHHVRLNRLLREYKIRPAFPAQDVPATFFRRKDLQRISEALGLG